jgi:O-antigen ligase
MNLLLSILFLFLPTYLIRFNLGPIPTTLLEVMIWVIFVVWIIKVIKFDKLKTVINRLSHISYLNLSLVISISIFLLSATYSAFVTSINTRAALGEWKAFYIEPFLIFLILIIEGTKNSEKKTDNLSPISYRLSPIHSLLFALILCGLVTSLLAIYQHFTGWLVPYAFWANRATYRVTAWYGFPNAVGIFLAPLIPLAIFNIGDIRYKIVNNKKNILYLVSLITAVTFIPSAILAIIFAKSTGGLIGTAAGIGLLLVFWKKTRWPVLITGALAILSIFFVLPKTNSIREELLMQDRSGQIRINMWGEAIELLKTRPIEGAGLASYQKLIVPYHHQVNGDNIEIFHHEHNIFLTMWVNLGLFGLIGFVWMLVWFYRVGLQNIISYHPSPLSIYLLASMTALVVTGLVDSPYIKNDLSLFFWLILALMFITTQSQYNNIICQKDKDEREK